MTARKKPDTDSSIEAFLSALPGVKPTADGPYTYTDRYRDFARVFSTDEGKRVFSQILMLCDKPVTEADLGKPELMIWRHATRLVGLKITEWATVPPRQTS